MKHSRPPCKSLRNKLLPKLVKCTPSSSNKDLLRNNSGCFMYLPPISSRTNLAIALFKRYLHFSMALLLVKYLYDLRGKNLRPDNNCIWKFSLNCPEKKLQIVAQIPKVFLSNIIISYVNHQVRRWVFKLKHYSYLFW